MERTGLALLDACRFLARDHCRRTRVQNFGTGRTMTTRALVFLSLIPSFLLGPGDGLGAQQRQDAGSDGRRVIIFVWDGLRADDATPENMPNYFALARSGVVFADHHSVYPTFTMMNSASIATGTYPAVHGFYGSARASALQHPDTEFVCLGSF
jgi:Type I phosphodiesterase / nucleotide pyrophosphatase